MEKFREAKLRDLDSSITALMSLGRSDTQMKLSGSRSRLLQLINSKGARSPPFFFAV